MSEPQDPLLREIEEDLRRERFEKLWKKYGGVVVGAAVAVVLVVAGYQGWQAYLKNAREEAGERFAQAAQLAETDAAAAASAFSALSESATKGYAFLSRLRAAALYSEIGETQEPIEIYARIENDAGDTVHKDLAVLLRGFAILGNPDRAETDAEPLTTMLEPLTAPGRPMRHSARELLAIAAVARGDQKRAREILDEARADPQTPADMRQRAEQFLQQIHE